MYQTNTNMRSALKWLVLLPVFIFFLIFLKTPVFAATTQTQPTNQYLAPVTNPGVPQNLHTYTQSIFIELLSTGYCTLVGYDPVYTNQKCLGIDQNTHKIGFVENSSGLYGALGGLFSMAYAMPTSSSQYIKYMTENFGISKKAYAANNCVNSLNPDQGIGFCLLDPITNIWVRMRDIVYLLFTVVFIVVGLGIMLRVQVDPRTVMTLENQIPKIIIGILMVTFSLAIAGLLIDVMYLAIYLIGNVLSVVATSSGLAGFDSNYAKIATSTNPFQALSFIGGGGGVSFNIASGITDVIIKSIFGTVQTPFTIPVLGWDLGGVLLFLILWFVFLLALFIAMIRVWITLIISYINILLDIVFAPFWFVGGLLPGGSLGVGAWFRDMLANLAVFPATVAMLALALIFAHIGDGAGDGNLFTPPMVGAGVTSAATLGKVIMFGFVFMIPQALSIMKAAFKAPKFNLGPVFAPTIASVGVVRSSVSAGAAFRSSTQTEMAETGWRRVLRRTVG